MNIDLVIKALKAEGDWCSSDDDRITAEVGYRLRRVAERIEETRPKPDPWTRQVPVCQIPACGCTGEAHP